MLPVYVLLHMVRLDQYLSTHCACDTPVFFTVPVAKILQAPG